MSSKIKKPRPAFFEAVIEGLNSQLHSLKVGILPHDNLKTEPLEHVGYVLSIIDRILEGRARIGSIADDQGHSPARFARWD